ncbi:MAG: DUF5309 domain-containing protein [Synergistaceae bacterium]|nr:DUF5309 domain-containing protein [Synergistaceae bacterium]
MASNTYAAVGNKEDVSDIITNISPSDTPLYSRIGKTKAQQVTHEWLEDELGSPTVNQQEEGYTYFTMNVAPRTRLNNYTQIMHRGIQVTDTQEAVLHYGVRSEMAYQMAKTLKELAFDCEQALITQATKQLGSMAPGDPRIFGGLPYWIVTHVFNNNGTARPLTFDLINTALEQVWTGGGKPSILLVSPRNKRVISTFTAGSTKYMDGNKTNKLTNMISVLETDFGTLQCLTDRFMPNDVVYGLSPEYIKKAFLRNFKTGDIPKINDMGRRMVNGEWTLEMRAEKAHFKIEDLDGVVPTLP